MASHGIEVNSLLIRTEINGREVSFLAQGTRDSKPIVVVGAAKSRFDRVEAIRQVEAQVEVARAMYPGVAIQPLLVTHYARPHCLSALEAKASSSCKALSGSIQGDAD